MTGKFIAVFFGLMLVIFGGSYLFYVQTGYKFGLDRTILSRGVIDISSPYFANGGKIPAIFTCDGIDFSPDIVINDYFFDAKSLVVIMDDEEVLFKPFTHWITYNIRPSKTNINSSKVLENAETGINDFGKQEYSGPCPPQGETHTYNFKIYALDTMLNLNNPTRRDLNKAITGHIIATGKLSGVYSKNR